VYTIGVYLGPVLVYQIRTRRKLEVGKNSRAVYAIICCKRVHQVIKISAELLQDRNQSTLRHAVGLKLFPVSRANGGVGNRVIAGVVGVA